MLLINPRDVVWDLVPFDFRLSEESLAWLRRNTRGDYSLDDDEDSAPSSPPRLNAEQTARPHSEDVVQEALRKQFEPK